PRGSSTAGTLPRFAFLGSVFAASDFSSSPVGSASAAGFWLFSPASASASASSPDELSASFAAASPVVDFPLPADSSENAGIEETPNPSASATSSTERILDIVKSCATVRRNWPAEQATKNAPQTLDSAR